MLINSFFIDRFETVNGPKIQKYPGSLPIKSAIRLEYTLIQANFAHPKIRHYLLDGVPWKSGLLSINGENGSLHETLSTNEIEPTKGRRA
ncbi:hypothetical protein ADIS_2466 [Lunatimonas lonarensis]|uniref:Uncharacterized protein n=1 Tax=Lunatimonas lonarensis TaxID=1232681 RepID=R7ZSF4_9BACT|nr:hypothetical protein ADIS_2466 [Lunatimonas lonarensis]